MGRNTNSPRLILKALQAMVCDLLGGIVLSCSESPTPIEETNPKSA